MDNYTDILKDASQRQLDIDGMVVLSVYYINAHRTAMGSFTSSQIKALGLDRSTLRSGWIYSLYGKTITPEQADVFEAKEYKKRDRIKKTKSFYDVRAIKKDIENIIMSRASQLRKSKISDESLMVIFEYDRKILQLFENILNNQ